MIFSLQVDEVSRRIKTVYRIHLMEVEVSPEHLVRALAAEHHLRPGGLHPARQQEHRRARPNLQ